MVVVFKFEFDGSVGSFLLSRVYFEYVFDRVAFV
jgi:hypothetical protein